ncbi:conserved hypothetical protein [Culex quinquefasciatus]|uniref:PHD-type domain-containing protein n=1 Tax=Culex quinquefasciatus TaxID=7176 RepID=B0XJD6_CULQU|nr:conserved hypothetical protein [Culex quinquefasciatus]|eukprot:XP_001869758.1 conserved hypothetical protein [Culex quinquefasciatus]
MPKSSNCDAEVCLGKAANRSPRVRCEICSTSVHLKCANLDNTVVKPLRDSAGLCWLCPNCRDPEKRKSTSNSNTIDLILQRSTSTLKLVGALMDTVQILSRLIRTMCSRPVCSAGRPSALDDEFPGNHDPLNFTEIFESIMNAELENWLNDVTVLRAGQPTVDEAVFVQFMNNRLTGAARVRNKCLKKPCGCTQVITIQVSEAEAEENVIKTEEIVVIKITKIETMNNKMVISKVTITSSSKATTRIEATVEIEVINITEEVVIEELLTWFRKIRDPNNSNNNNLSNHVKRLM